MILSFSDTDFANLGRGEFHNPELLARLQDAHNFRVTAYLASLVRMARGEYEEVVRSIEFEATYAQFVQLEQDFPDIVQDFLDYPYVGSWANAAVRDHADLANSEALWGKSNALPRYMAHFGAITAAIALRAQAEHNQPVSFSVIVPITRGMIRLPSLGGFRVQEKKGLARLTRDEHGLSYTVLAEDAPTIELSMPDDLEQTTRRWRPLWRLRSTIDDLEISLILDDIDAHAVDSREGEPMVVTESDKAKWQQLLDEAWEILVRMHRSQAETLAQVLVALAPMQAPSPTEGRSATAHDAFGSIMLTYPGTGVELARIMVHELRHGLLSVVARHCQLCEERKLSNLRLYRTPWRDDPRPIDAVLDGVYSFAGEAAFWHRLVCADNKTRRRAEFELARWVGPTCATLDDVLASPGAGSLTPQGRIFATGILEQLAGLSGLELTPQIVEVAKLIEKSHRLEWRLRCRTPDPRCVDAYIEAFQLGLSPHEPLPWKVTAHLDHPKRSSQVRQDLLRAKALWPEEFETLIGDFERAAYQFPGLTRADVLFTRGDYLAACEEYLSQITKLPESVQAWVGFALSDYFVRGADPLAKQRLSMTEKAYWIFLTLSARGHQAPTPKELVDWLMNMSV